MKSALEAGDHVLHRECGGLQWRQRIAIEGRANEQRGRAPVFAQPVGVSGIELFEYRRGDVTAQRRHCVCIRRQGCRRRQRRLHTQTAQQRITLRTRFAFGGGTKRARGG